MSMTRITSLVLRRQVNVKNSRSLSLSQVRQDIFKVQDEADFKNKVLDSKEPVVIDFFAT